ncbi:bifunctional DNA primase/polymerase [Thermodesulfobacteriota bacterium]
MSKNLKAAKWHAKKGFSVIPVRTDKKPYIKWEQYQTEKAGPDQIQEWWKKWPSANVGIVTGAISGIDVIDVDSQAGLETLKKHLPDNLVAPIVETPGGGWHYYEIS